MAVPEPAVEVHDGCDPDVTLFICVSCKSTTATSEPPGRILFDAVTAVLGAQPGVGIGITPVECLGVCKRPCTVALAGRGKWTYVIGDLDPETHVGDVVAATLRYGATSNGIIPWRERPQSFRKGVVSRVPPLGFRLPERGE